MNANALAICAAQLVIMNRTKSKTIGILCSIVLCWSTCVLAIRIIVEEVCVSRVSCETATEWVFLVVVVVVVVVWNRAHTFNKSMETYWMNRKRAIGMTKWNAMRKNKVFHVWILETRWIHFKTKFILIHGNTRCAFVNEYMNGCSPVSLGQRDVMSMVNCSRSIYTYCF